MTKSLFFLFFAVILFTSCKEDEDTAPSFLSGVYEISWENTDTGFWHVSQYIFKTDGTYERVSLLRASEHGATIGYSFYSKNTYTLHGNEFSTQVVQSAGVNYEEYPIGYVESMDKLEQREVSVDVMEFKGVLKRIDGGKKMSILMECNDMLTGMLSMCMGEQIYDRVN